MTEAGSGWLALDIKDIDEKKLLPGVIDQDGTPPHLPTQMLKIPFDNPGQVAVVSWRWDGDLHMTGSRNIASVIRVAKQRDIRYLFIDIISIDQKLPPGDLIAQVAAFSTLYTKITVLAAYDVCADGNQYHLFRNTVLRPWILNEMRLFRKNPGRVVYVGHNNLGSVSTHFDSLGILPIRDQETMRPCFLSILEELWCATIINSIIGVLAEEVGMSLLSDFKYIIPAYSHIFSTAYERMERNDYLLTVAIFCGNYKGSRSLITGHLSKWAIHHLRFSRYSFTAALDRWVETDSLVDEDENWELSKYEIALDGIRVAQWSDHYFSDITVHIYTLNLYDGSERSIFAALGLADSDYEDFVATEEARIACLQVDNRKELPVPAVEVIEVDLLSE